ncbi:hypothetical protein GOQ29_13740 [Clostridium sp. D2Q-14]|uniref:alpha/beta fold hydrolase n=1 Tax=Anaeromonas gelatinilytica TaxID=2683194 RepID=UPI00193C3FAB|nr:hypothetical protein [Anaeromonas gelatinilytica]MBS4536681.1 hypothetical protein [Anaeromonas gelatinilytica]
MKQHFLDNNNTKVRVCEWGRKENPTIICLHGLGSTNFSFLELGELLGNKYHIFSIDLPGMEKHPHLKRMKTTEFPI